MPYSQAILKQLWATEETGFREAVRSVLLEIQKATETGVAENETTLLCFHRVPGIKSSILVEPAEMLHTTAPMHSDQFWISDA